MEEFESLHIDFDSGFIWGQYLHTHKQTWLIDRENYAFSTYLLDKNLRAASGRVEVL